MIGDRRIFDRELLDSMDGFLLKEIQLEREIYVKSFTLDFPKRLNAKPDIGSTNASKNLDLGIGNTVLMK